MKIDVTHVNDAIKMIVDTKGNIIFLDANIFIPPDRTSLGARHSIEFDLYRDAILDPMFNAWTNLAIHEAVYNELVEGQVRKFADDMKMEKPPRLVIHSNDNLSLNEKAIYNAHVDKLAQFSNYYPDLDNADDRGEIQSLAYMAVRGYIYFSANDHLPIRLITRAEELETGLETMSVIQMYEIIYILHRYKLSDDEKLRIIYRYMYYATKKDKKINPGWNDFFR